MQQLVKKLLIIIFKLFSFIKINIILFITRLLIWVMKIVLKIIKGFNAYFEPRFKVDNTTYGMRSPYSFSRDRI